MEAEEPDMPAELPTNPEDRAELIDGEIVRPPMLLRRLSRARCRRRRGFGSVLPSTVLTEAHICATVDCRCPSPHRWPTQRALHDPFAPKPSRKHHV